MENENLGDSAQAGAASPPKPSDCDVLVYVGPITREGFRRVVDQSPGKKGNKVLLLLSTLGGNADAAYRIARFLRRSYGDFTVLVPSLCKSAGTLLCIGANEIVISETGELGPLDVQVQHPGELADYGSGLDVPEAFSFLQAQTLDTLRSILVDMAAGSGLGTERSAEIATKVVVGLFSPAFTQIDASRLGRNARALSIAKHYAERLPGNIKSDDALERLITGYPSHSFAIDREEASALFKRVREPNEFECTLAQASESLLTAYGISSRDVIVQWQEERPTHESVEAKSSKGRCDQADSAGAVGSLGEAGASAGKDIAPVSQDQMAARA